MAKEINLIDCVEELTQKQIVMRDDVYVYFDTKKDVEKKICLTSNQNLPFYFKDIPPCPTCSLLFISSLQILEGHHEVSPKPSPD